MPLSIELCSQLVGLKEAEPLENFFLCDEFQMLPFRAAETFGTNTDCLTIWNSRDHLELNYEVGCRHQEGPV